MKMSIREGIEGIWFYHLAEDDVPICGESKNKTMPTFLPITSWGMKSEHIPEKYCKKCNQIAKERGLVKEQ